MNRRLILAVIGMTGSLVLASTASAVIAIDGTLDAEYGPAVAVQDTPTGFGDNFSELNAAFAKLDGGNLSLLLTGNLEGNGNAIVLFVDSRAGGAIAEADVNGFGTIGSIGGARSDDWGNDTDGSENVSPNTPSILDPGFNPDFAIEINRFGGGNYFSNVIDFTLPNEPNPDRDIYIGDNPADGTTATTTYSRADTNVAKGHGGTIQHAFNNSNTAGVFGFDFGSPPGALGDPLSATTGYEIMMSAGFLANDGQPIRIMAFITNDGGNYLSNQFLGAAGLNGATNLAGPGDVGGVPLFDAKQFAGNQYFTIPTSTGPSGDFNNDGIWDARDYVIWRETDGTVAGYNAWKTKFGTGAGAGTVLGSATVPEPTAALLVVLGVLGAGIVRRK